MSVGEKGWNRLRAASANVVHEKVEQKQEARSNIEWLRGKVLTEDGKVNKNSAMLIKALQRREDDDFDNWIDRLLNEVFITCKILFEALSPAEHFQHPRIWTIFMTFVCCMITTYMMADYTWADWSVSMEKYYKTTAHYYRLGGKEWCSDWERNETCWRETADVLHQQGQVVVQELGDPNCKAFIANETCWKLYENRLNAVRRKDRTKITAADNEIMKMYYPSLKLRESLVRARTHELDRPPGRRLGDWITHKSPNEWRKFNADYLVFWGGRYAVKIAADGETWRWITSLALHESLDHLLANLALFIPLSYQLERKYGASRIFATCLISGLGGNFASVLFEDPCIVVVGASGMCFGMFGLFIADMMLNYETIERPLMRICLMAMFFACFMLQVLTEGSTSHVSHAGGLLCGLMPSFLFLPNFNSEKWEAMLPPLGLLTVLCVFVFMPIAIYQSVLPDLCCYADPSRGIVGEGNCPALPPPPPPAVP